MISLPASREVLRILCARSHKDPSGVQSGLIIGLRFFAVHAQVSSDTIPSWGLGFRTQRTRSIGSITNSTSPKRKSARKKSLSFRCCNRGRHSSHSSHMLFGVWPLKRPHEDQQLERSCADRWQRNTSSSVVPLVGEYHISSLFSTSLTVSNDGVLSSGIIAAILAKLPRWAVML